MPAVKLEELAKFHSEFPAGVSLYTTTFGVGELEQPPVLGGGVLGGVADEDVPIHRRRVWPAPAPGIRRRVARAARAQDREARLLHQSGGGRGGMTARILDSQAKENLDYLDTIKQFLQVSPGSLVLLRGSLYWASHTHDCGRTPGGSSAARRRAMSSTCGALPNGQPSRPPRTPPRRDRKSVV